MSPFSLVGRVARATDLQPLAGVRLRLHGPASALADLSGAQTEPADQEVRWTRQLTGFAGNRWQCWTQHVEGRNIPISWEQFRDGALAHNPGLVPERVFRADQSYLLPEAVALPSYTWTRQLSGFTGNRWQCWETLIRATVPGLSWEQFRDDALRYNPQLNADGRIFNPAKAYLLPEPASGPRAYLSTTSDADGHYRFVLGQQAAVCELQVELDDYARFVLPLAINGELTQPVLVQPLAGAGPAAPVLVRSARTDYPTLPELARRAIDQALLMLGDDVAVYDALPPALQQMCYGARFAHDPNHFNYKDIVCADLVSIALAAAGCDIRWGGAANPHMADYYHPDRGNSKLIEITNPQDWLPGDVLVYGRDQPGSRAGHVNLYVGPMSGTDRSGKRYSLSDGNDVVEASIDFMSQGRQIGTGVIGCNLQRCLQAKRGIYTWVRHVRLRELAAAFGRA